MIQRHCQSRYTNATLYCHYLLTQRTKTHRGNEIKCVCQIHPFICINPFPFTRINSTMREMNRCAVVYLQNKRWKVEENHWIHYIYLLIHFSDHRHHIIIIIMFHQQANYFLSLENIIILYKMSISQCIWNWRIVGSPFSRCCGLHFTVWNEL